MFVYTENDTDSGKRIQNKNVWYKNTLNIHYQRSIWGDFGNFKIHTFKKLLLKWQRFMLIFIAVSIFCIFLAIYNHKTNSQQAESLLKPSCFVVPYGKRIPLASWSHPMPCCAMSRLRQIVNSNLRQGRYELHQHGHIQHGHI